MNNTQTRGHSLFPSLLTTTLCFVSIQFILVQGLGAADLILEIVPQKGKAEIIRLEPSDISQIGINERMGDIQVEVALATRYHEELKEMTEKNIGKDLSIRKGSEIIYSGRICEPLSNGRFTIPCSSEKEARDLIEGFGRQPDYHLKLTPEEIEDAKLYTKPAKNPWSKKSIEALLLGDYTKAEHYAKKAIESDPEEPMHYANLGYLYYEQGKLKLSLEQYLLCDSAIKQEDIGKYPGIYGSLGEIYAALGEYDKAIDYLKKYLSYDNANLNAHLWLAKTYEKARMFDLAFQEYKFLSESHYKEFQELGLECIEGLKNSQ